MSDNWWEQAYKGGPMVAVKGFPRPLYPPDAAMQGKQPSANGPDVEAYKRTVARAGRWKWQQFDQAYSNGFAHGNGPNVSQTGVAGVQRQQKIDDSGWIGKNTFNTLRSIRCPEGPHEGEMAMDAYSVELINRAWEIYQGKPTPEPDTGSSAEERLRMATTQLGYNESPAGSNQNKYGAWYGMNGQPWCAMFCTWCDQMGDYPSGSFKKGSRYSYVPYIVSDAQLGKNGLKTTSTPKAGDMVCYDWDRDGAFDHVGLFEAWRSDYETFTAVEGNTSTSNNSNGGEVMRRTRNITQQRTVFVRVVE